jgi:hypothetical protein
MTLHPSLTKVLSSRPVVSAWTGRAVHPQTERTVCWDPILVVRYADGSGNMYTGTGHKMFRDGVPFDSDDVQSFLDPAFWSVTKVL